MHTASVAYIPVLHAGYLEFLNKSSSSVLYVLGREVLDSLPAEFDYVRRKDAIRALPSGKLVSALSAIVPDVQVQVADLEAFEMIRASFGRIVMPDEDVSRHIGERHFAGYQIEYLPIFLRWDRQAVLKQEAASVVADVAISTEELDRVFLQEAQAVAERSADWWRQIGAVLVKDDTIIYAANNHHTPHPQAPNAFGDPRCLFNRGVRMECSTAEHAEAAIIAAAAKLGVSTLGSSLYTTAFPCPQCARLIAYAGVKKVLFSGGYAVLDGADEMRRQGVELVYVDIT